MPNNTTFMQCPHCCYKDTAACEYFDPGVFAEEIEIVCGSCSKIFLVSREIDISYKTRPKEGKCE